MVICVDFDGTIVRADQAYHDVTSPLVFMPGAREGLLALKAAGHQLILWSSRSSPCLYDDPELHPLVVSGERVVHERQWNKDKALSIARYEQMLAFVERELTGVFDGVDNGICGKVPADMYIDDKAVTFGNRLGGNSWADIASTYGESPMMALKASLFKEQR